MSRIKYLIMDVDGTLTDGKVYIGSSGEMFKAFDVKDGCGILLLLPKINIVPVIITGRSSEIVSLRCKELNITNVFQGVDNKLDTMLSFLAKHKAELSEVAYIGDDIPDIECMELIIDSGGLACCPNNAILEIKRISNYISPLNGGEGAVRDIIEHLQ